MVKINVKKKNPEMEGYEKQGFHQNWCDKFMFWWKFGNTVVNLRLPLIFAQFSPSNLIPILVLLRLQNVFVHKLVVWDSLKG